MEKKSPQWMALVLAFSGRREDWVLGRPRALYPAVVSLQPFQCPVAVVVVLLLA